jgi:fructose-1,6-bisphosphatase/inositol monophosphatase family enzyme
VSADLDKSMEFATTVAREAGDMILEYFDADQQVEFKQDNTPVTIADKLINDHVIQRIAQTLPEHGVVGEEASSERVDQEYIWFCDPIDGTKAFTWGLPTAMFSLALVTKGRPVLGVAYDPFLKRMYTAMEGEPAYCNGQEIHVSDQDLSNGTLTISVEQNKLMSNKHKYLVEKGVRLGLFSGYVYKGCLIARGKLVGHAEDNVGRHDVAALDVIIRGAGGKVTSYENEPLDFTKPLGGVAMSNGIIHDELLKIAQIK